MEKPTNITVAALHEIRDEIRRTNTCLDQTNTRLDDLKQDTAARFDELGHRVDDLGVRLGQRVDDLGRRLVDSELRTATALTDLAGSVREMTSVLRASAELRPRVERCELDIADIKRKLAS